MHTPKSLRIDAARNKVRVLDAAEKVFAEEGLAASTDRIAMRAGVGIGTVFRHFSTKELLLQAVLDRQVSALVSEANALLATSNDEGETFRLFLRRAFELAATKKVLVAALEKTGNPATLDTNNRTELLRTLDALFKRAQRSGKIRQDINLDELVALMQGLLQSNKYIQSGKSAREHVLDIVLDGLRPTTVSP
jgi:AcrR family transcriptional regulator